MSRGERIALIAVAALAAGLRLSRLDLMEFKGDEAAAILLAAPILHGGGWPGVALRSSVGLYNPPLFLYMLAAPLAVSFNPIFVAASLVGGLGVLGVLLTFVVIRPRFGSLTALAAAALFAASPWAVLYGRKIWAPDVSPLFLVVLLHVLFTVSERRRSGIVALVPVLFGILWQLHFSALALVPVCAAVLLIRSRDISWRHFVLGTAIAAAMLFPYMHFQQSHDWIDVRGFARLASGLHADGSPAASDHAPRSVAVMETFRMSGGASFDYPLGRSTEAYEATRTAMANALRSAGTWAAWGLMVIGLCVSLVRGLTGATWRRRWPVLDPPPEALPYLIVCVWLFGVWLFYALAHLEAVHRHYVIVTYPVPFVLGAIGVREIALKIGTGGRLAALVLVGLVVTSHVESLVSLERFVDRTGGTSGDYGTVYRFKADAVRFAAGNGLMIRRAPGYEYRILLEEAQKFQALGDLQRDDEAPGLSSGYRGLAVYDTLREPASDISCPGRHDFGPLVACPVP